MSNIKSDEYWADKGGVKLYIYRKRDIDAGADLPVLFLVHGSSFAARTAYDMEIPGHPDYSMMDEMARYSDRCLLPCPIYVV